MLRISFLLDTPELKRWQQRLIERLIAQDPEIRLGALRYCLDGAEPASRLQHSFLAFEQETLCPNPKALAPKDLSVWPNADVGPWQRDEAWPECDLILDLTARGHHHWPPNLGARLWWWSVSAPVRGHGDLRGLVEFQNLAPSLCSQLLETRPKHTAQVVLQTHSCVDALSLMRGMNPVYWKLCEITYRSLRRLAAGQAPFLPAAPEGATRHPCTAKGLSLWRLARRYARYVHKKFRERQHIEQWSLLIQTGESPKEATSIGAEIPQFQAILPPMDRFWADPFVAEQDGQRYVFVEEADIKQRVGHLSVMRLSESGELGPSEPILSRPYHLSYPQVFQHDGRWYLLPESGEDQSVQLFAATRFPNQWQPVATLLSGMPMYDATLLHRQDTWWLFVTCAPVEGMSGNDELHLFFSDQLTGPWRAHPLNPVLSDARCARPAGQLFWRNGQLIRPAQNCTPRYGYGLAFQHVELLSKTQYRERTLETVQPDPKSPYLGLHTYNRGAGIQISDAIYFRPKQ